MMSQPEVVVVQPEPPPKYEGPPQPEKEPLSRHQDAPLGKASGGEFSFIRVYTSDAPKQFFHFRPKNSVRQAKIPEWSAKH